MRRRPWAILAVPVLALAAASPAMATVSAGHSGWSWANPSPQGEDLADVAFSGTSGYAVGAFGTLLRSTDAGDTWTGVPSRTVQGLTRVTLTGPGGFVASGSCAVRRSADDGATVSTIDVGGGDTGCGTTVQATAFAGASGAVLFANGVVLTTTDGGVTLSRRTPVPNGAPTDIVATAPGTFFATSGNAVLRSTDGGGSWTLMALIARTLRGLTFATPSVGYAVGDSGTVLRTIDGGASWIPTTSPGGDVSLTRIRCADALVCVATQNGSGTVIRTTDGGGTWTRVTTSARAIRSVAFASPTRVVAVGDGGATVVSDDAGATWRTVGAAIEGVPTTIAAGTGGFAYAVGTNAIALTADGGATWRSVGIPTPLPIGTAAFADPSTGYAQDTGGTIRRTRDGGASWQVIDPGAGTRAPVRILALASGRVLLVGPNGVSRSVDGGDTFRVVTSKALRGGAAIRARPIAVTGSNAVAFIAGRTGILRSGDAGATWARVALPRIGRRPPRLASADCIAPRTCWIVTTGSRAYRTIDAGRRWTEVTAGIGLPLRDVTAVA
ncbi:MAG TPA: YCF48-related protein, partial [Miltoncostaea sp.]|nr:YCF48-related protein [Miltoncostaea sp.]